MNINPLNITAVDNKPSTAAVSDRKTRRQTTQATMERQWLVDPVQFDPMSNSMGRHRIKKTLDAMRAHIALPVSRAVDLGCGYGVITRMLCEQGCHVDAVDISSYALQHVSQSVKGLPSPDIALIQDCLPSTSLADEAYKLVVCTDVIGYLDPNEYRFLFSELARLVSSDGHVVCSAELDIDTEDPLQHFAALAETEFTFDAWYFSHHRLFIKLCRFFDTPAQYAQAGQSPLKRQKDSKARHGLGKLWFRANTSRIGSSFWKIVSVFTTPLANAVKQSDALLRMLEPVSRFLWSDDGISHTLFIGQRRPLTYQVAADKAPVEIKHKRQVWE